MCVICNWGLICKGVYRFFGLSFYLFNLCMLCVCNMYICVSNICLICNDVCVLLFIYELKGLKGYLFVLYEYM